MALVLNALNKEQQVRIFGAWFTFKAKQIKDMDENKVHFLTSRRSYEGYVSLPEEMSDIAFQNSKEGQEILQEALARGVANRVAYLEMLKHNELVSLQRDLDIKNLKYDARVEMSAAMIKNFEELASYKKSSKAADNEKVAKIKGIESELEGK